MDLRALIFVPVLAGVVVVGFPFALFAASAFLSVLQGTGAGAKQIEWNRDSVPENLWKAFYLVWLVGLWAGPAVIFGRWVSLRLESPFLALAVPLVALWLMYPISQLSSLSGPTIWLPLWPDVFRRLAQKPAVTLGFYGLSGVALVGFGLAFSFTFGNTPPLFLVFGAPLLVLFGLLYARLLGRLAFVMSFAKPWRQRKKVKARKPRLVANETDEANPLTRSSPKERHRIQQPSEMAPIDSPDEGPIHGYDVNFVDEVPELPPPPPPVPRKPAAPVYDENDPAQMATKRRREKLDRAQRWDEEDDDATPYIANAPEVVEGNRAPKELVVPLASEMRLLSRAENPKNPKRVWTSELFVFLGQPDTYGVMARLIFFCGVLGALVKLARYFNPAGGGGD